MPETSPPGPFGFDGAAEIIAHRGFSARAPENTLAALELGIDAGADAVEFDLHSTEDGVPVLLHDSTLDRTTDGSGPVHRRTLDAGSWFDPAFAGEPVPTLASVLTAVGGRVARIYAEVKRDPRPEDVARLTGLVVDAGLLDRTVFISMDWNALDGVRRIAPEALVGYIVEKRGRAADAIERAAGDDHALLDFDARILLKHPTLATRARAARIPLATWTVDSLEDASRLLDMGVPRITTNRVADLVAWKEAL